MCVVGGQTLSWSVFGRLFGQPKANTRFLHFFAAMKVPALVTGRPLAPILARVR
jgi:hypothetical protein